MSLSKLSLKGLAEASEHSVSELSSDSLASRWQASLALTVGKTTRGTRLLGSRHYGPLYVQKPFYPEGKDLAHIYLLHPPGGIVSGDELSIDLALDVDSQALFTTPGAGRIYRARADQALQSQTVTIQLSEHSSAEWLPLENIIYPFAHGQLTTVVKLAKKSHFLGWEITSLGLPASGQTFDNGRLNQKFEVYIEDKPQFIERLWLDCAEYQLLSGKAGFQQKMVNGLLVAGPFDNAFNLDELIDNLRKIVSPSDSLQGVTVVNNLIIIRFLGNCNQQAKAYFIACWKLLRPQLLNREICCPRIWAT